MRRYRQYSIPIVQVNAIRALGYKGTDLRSLHEFFFSWQDIHTIEQFGNKGEKVRVSEAVLLGCLAGRSGNFERQKKMFRPEGYTKSLISGDKKVVNVGVLAAEAAVNEPSIVKNTLWHTLQGKAGSVSRPVIISIEYAIDVLLAEFLGQGSIEGMGKFGERGWAAMDDYKENGPIVLQDDAGGSVVDVPLVRRVAGSDPVGVEELHGMILGQYAKGVREALEAGLSKIEKAILDLGDRLASR